MTFQEMELASMHEADAEDFDLSNVTDDENENELILQSLIMMKSF